MPPRQILWKRANRVTIPARRSLHGFNRVSDRQGWELQLLGFVSGQDGLKRCSHPFELLDVGVCHLSRIRSSQRP